MKVDQAGQGQLATPVDPRRAGVCGEQLGAGILQNGFATIRLRAWVLPVGTHTVTVSYQGNGVALPSSTTATVRVVRH